MVSWSVSRQSRLTRSIFHRTRLSAWFYLFSENNTTPTFTFVPQCVQNVVLTSWWSKVLIECAQYMWIVAKDWFLLNANLCLVVRLVLYLSDSINLWCRKWQRNVFSLSVMLSKNKGQPIIKRIVLFLWNLIL